MAGAGAGAGCWHADHACCGGRRQKLKAKWEKFWDSGYDVLLCPVAQTGGPLPPSLLPVPATPRSSLLFLVFLSVPVRLIRCSWV